VFSTSDTIVAIATPPGRGGIGVVRLSGPDAHAIAQRLTNHAGFAPRYATLTTLDLSSASHSADAAADHVVVTYFPAPASYTGDDVVEVSAHGSPVILEAIVNGAMGEGARLAERGEFTLRAFLNGRIDLLQAEAVHDLIESVTPLQARAAFDQLNGTLTEAIAHIDAALFDLIARLEASVDFPEEGYHFVEPSELASSIDAIAERTSALLREARRGRLVREGLQIAIVGPPNAGKSSLFNALVGSARAIVTDVPGTTRDLITETVDIDGLQVTLVDTAGLRETADAIESEGVARSRRAVDSSDAILAVFDRSATAVAGGAGALELPRDKPVIVVSNKADLPERSVYNDSVHVSSRTMSGLDELRTAMKRALDVDLPERPRITNLRHAELVARADTALRRARDAAFAGGRAMPEEFVLADLQDARAALEEVTGRRTSDDVLTHIFSTFCIGK
jgi:tRNA modification GTPase